MLIPKFVRLFVNPCSTCFVGALMGYILSRLYTRFSIDWIGKLKTLVNQFDDTKGTFLKYVDSWEGDS